MENLFKNSLFRFIKKYVDLTDYLEKLYTLEATEDDILVKNKNQILHFIKLKEKIEIQYNGEKFEIYKVPICFENEKNETLFKVYNDQQLDSIINNNLLKEINIDFDFYSKTNTKLSTDEIVKNKIKTVILKPKINQLENIFKPLCEILPTDVENITIKTNCLLPEGSQSLLLDLNSNLELIVKQRNVLISKILEFMKKDNKLILKIYGSDGIGKSVTLLYLTSIKTDYKIIYFNLKDIYNFNSDKVLYFKNALLKYYSSSYRANSVEEKPLTKEDEESAIEYYYNEYLKDIQYMENKISNDFWEMLIVFCQFIRYVNNSIIIIDQYKEDYDKDKKLYNLIKMINNQKIKKMKFIISSSLNDNSVKEELRIDLMYIFKNEISVINLLEKSNEKRNSIENIIEDLFNDLKFDEKTDEKEEVDDDDDLNHISLLNIPMDDSKTANSEDKKENNFDEEKNLVSKLKLSDSDKKLIEATEIIYINNLISIESLVKEEDEKKFYKIFSFNPKTYKKYSNSLSAFSAEPVNKIRISFLNQSFKEINFKINLFYKVLQPKFKRYSQEGLKGTFLMKLNDIIINKKTLNLKELIQYLEVFPFKYLKIYIDESEPCIGNNIIELNERLNEKLFRLDYSYEFIEIAFAKIIDMISPSTLISISDLTGSAIGSLLESKIKRNIDNKNYKIRYLWDFSTKDIKGKKDKYIYDFKEFTKTKLKYDDIDYNNPIIDTNSYYYILPGSQTNKLLDAVILKPYGFNSYNMISLQMTKLKVAIKSKKDYVNACFKAKEKFERVYGIKINRMYFYFILAEDFDNEQTKIELEIKNISYFYYSIIKDSFTKNKNTTVYLDNLDDNDAEIFNENEADDYQNFDSKLASINAMEMFLQKKRRLDTNLKITQNLFESARIFIIKQKFKIHLDKKTKEKMMNIVVKGLTKYSSKPFIFKFVFYINSYEFYKIQKNDNLIGLSIHKNENKEIKYNFIYNGVVYPIDENIPNKYLSNDNNKRRKIVNLDQNYDVSKLPEKFWDLIFVFKLYFINKEPNKKNQKYKI